MLLKKIISRLKAEKFSARFILSRFLWKTKICNILSIQRDGYKLIFFPTALSASLWYKTNERNEDLEILRNILDLGDTYIDVGANIGDLALYAKKIVGDDGYVLAIEPHPKIYTYLVKNIMKNNLNIITKQVAIGDKKGEIHFTNKRSDDQNHIEKNGGITINITTLDDLLHDIEKINLLKIDIEGYEYFSLLGAKNILHKVDVIYFELWQQHLDRVGVKKEDIFILLLEYGFSFKLTNQNKIDDIYSLNIKNCTNIIAEK